MESQLSVLLTSKQELLFPQSVVITKKISASFNLAAQLFAKALLEFSFLKKRNDCKSTKGDSSPHS